MGQAVDEMNRQGPVITEGQSASLSASVRVRYGRLTEVSKCVHRDVQLMHHALLPMPYASEQVEGVGDVAEALGKL